MYCFTGILKSAKKTRINRYKAGKRKKEMLQIVAHLQPNEETPVISDVKNELQNIFYVFCKAILFDI